MDLGPRKVPDFVEVIVLFRGPVMQGHRPGPRIVPEYAKTCIVKEPWTAGAGHWGDQRGLSLRGQEERQGP